jgi:hypothetical protein
VIAAAIEIAREAALDVAGAEDVGEHEGVRSEGHRLATHYFRSNAPGYRGWRWAVTMARAPRAKAATVCEVSLLAGDDAIVAPPWTPWSERLQPGDVGREDVLPYSPDDPRLMQGFEATGDVDVDELAIVELGLGRPRVLSPDGRAEATSRWYASAEHGPIRVSAGGPGGRGDRRNAPLEAQCSTCGFLMLMAGSMRTVFGVCANEWSPEDGRVVSMDHGCGAHSETDVLQGGSDWPDRAPVIDEDAIELFDHTAGSDAPRGTADRSPDTSPDADAPADDSPDAAADDSPDAEGLDIDSPDDDTSDDSSEADSAYDSSDEALGGADSDSAAVGGSAEPGDPDEHAPSYGASPPPAESPAHVDVAGEAAAPTLDQAQDDAERAPADAADAESAQTEP